MIPKYNSASEMFVCLNIPSFKGVKYSDVTAFHKKCLFLDYTRLYMYILFTITVQTYNI